jgi:hypothetical protein
MFRLLCEFAIVLEYDEMNCNFVSGVLYNVLWDADFGIWNNHEIGILMNGRVTCVENPCKNSECMHVKCKFFVTIVSNNFARIKFISTKLQMPYSVFFPLQTNSKQIMKPKFLFWKMWCYLWLRAICSWGLLSPFGYR